jgi:siroheme synthase
MRVGRLRSGSISVFCAGIARCRHCRYPDVGCSAFPGVTAGMVKTGNGGIPCCTLKRWG